MHIHARSILTATAAACILAFAAGARAQCSNTWLTGVMLPTDGPNNFVNDATMWDPDGGGPAAPVLLIGAIEGVFTWDGYEWKRLGDPEHSPHTVDHVITHNGQPVARGTLVGNHGTVARWNGNGWLSLGQPGQAYDMVSFGGEIIIGGNSLTADGSSTNRIARWDGAAWRSMGAGLPDTCTTLAVIDLDGGGPNPQMLYAGCENGSMHRWNGATWQTLPAVGTFSVRALAGHNGVLYTASRSPPNFTTCQLFTWSEGAAAWTPVVGNFSNNIVGGATDVHTLLSWNGSLIAAGSFTHIAGTASRSVARLTGTTWSGMNGGVGWGQQPFEVNALASSSPSPSVLHAVGSFHDLFGPPSSACRHTAAWNGATWSPLVSPGQVYALAPFGTKMAIGGWFITGPAANEALQIRNIALWDGVALTPLGSGVNGAVRAMREHGSTSTVKSLVVGGDFTTAGGAAASRVAKWNQHDTNPFQTGWSAMGSGFNASVNALEIGYNGALVAGGAFNASGGQPLGYMARWNTSLNQWQPFATAGGSDMNGVVRAIKVYSVNPMSPLADVVTVAGGDFSTANGWARSRIAIWRDNPQNGSTPWAAMGAGFNNSVYAIERHNVVGVGNHIYAAGAFTSSGGFSLHRIARWDGTSWLVVGNGIGFDGTVYALRSVGGFLYAAGTFTNVDGIFAKNVARLNGTAWEAVGPGIPEARFALAAYRSEVLAAGQARDSALNGSTPPTEGVERFSSTGVSWFAQQPASQTRACGQIVTMSVTIANGYSASGAAIAWRRNGVPLSNGVTPHGSTISGANVTTLTISNLKAADAGTYDCVYSTTCGSVSSTTAELIITDCCPADVAPLPNGDGVVNVTDLLAVISAWGACASPPCAADINGDNQINVTDLLAVISAWGVCD